MCPEMEFLGQLVIRVGLCRKLNRRFALIPDFVIPRRRISRLGLARLNEHRGQRRGALIAAIDECMEGLGDEFYLPRSTAAGYLTLAVRAPPFGPAWEATGFGRTF